MGKIDELRTAEKIRRACRTCMHGKTCVKSKDGEMMIFHPSDIDGGKYDVPSYSHWTYWQGNLDSKVAIVAPYWGTNFQLVRQEGRNDSSNNTTRNLATLLEGKGIKITMPEIKQQANEVFFTNAMLCMVAEDPDNDHVPLPSEKELWKSIENCNQHLARGLKAIRPPSIITLGKLAYKAVLLAFGRRSMCAEFSTLDEVVRKGPIKLLNGITLYPQFIPGGRALQSRPLEQQVRDWETIPYLG